MGCVLGKCCTCNRYTASSESDMAQFCDASPCGSRGKHILTGRSLECVRVPSHNYYMEYSLLTQRGYYPDSPDKGNQDSVCVSTKIRGNPNIHFFGVFDGHGQYGSDCSNFVKERVVQILCKDSALSQDPVRAYNSAFFTTNDELHKSKIDDSLSGTTAITVLVVGNMLYVANVGDSRAVIAVKDGNRIIAKDMSNDQTPFRKDECERVKLAGATVMTIDQIEGHKDPGIQIWGDEESQGNDPPRLWLPNSFYPGTAFTRSVGDSTAEKIGVTAVPEISVLQLTQNHLFFVVASDGVFEFLTSQAIVDMAARYTDPRDACAAIAGESYKLWLRHENRTDDITIIIVHIKGISASDAVATAGLNGVHSRHRIIERGTSERSAFAGSSEAFQSIRSDFSDVSISQHHVGLMHRSTAIVVPSPSQHRPLEVEVG
ncbi:probable protein phosphatase 2C 35 [Cucurbita maxima]|uniref:protein-serine/threonine phosphatase n=1 Tax=Cucurbita maxima TaxID=3661 RepID=A0A6J1KB19_CUCMA|nr:probable protein phosphatase 2C 35 [Cucurbita maxima]